MKVLITDSRGNPLVTQKTQAEVKAEWEAQHPEAAAWNRNADLMLMSLVGAKAAGATDASWGTIFKTWIAMRFAPAIFVLIIAVPLLIVWGIIAGINALVN